MGLWSRLVGSGSNGDGEEQSDGSGDEETSGDAVPSEFSVSERTVQRGKEVTRTIERPDNTTETYAGGWPQELFDYASTQPQQPTWLGYGKAQLREAGIDFENLFQHMAVFGTTGYGKSTVLGNLMYQWAHGGHGFCFIDPKGDTAREILESVPEHRVDDVIWIEPGADREQTVGFNFLDVGVDQTAPRYDAAIEALVEDLVALLRADRYWGARMDRVTQNLLRAMQRAEYDYTLLDVYYALLSEDNRQQFAEQVDEEQLPFIREYTQKIAELRDSDLEPLLGRFQPWVENPVIRQLLAHRDSPVNIGEAVENGKLVIVRNATESSTIGSMVATAVMRRVWATIKARKRVPVSDRDPFFLVVDEFDAVVNPEADIEQMLSKARAMQMGVTLCCQQPSQVPAEVRDAMFGNCDTLLSFRPGNPTDARQIAQRLAGVEAEVVNGTPEYHAWLRLALSDGGRSDPLRIQTFAGALPQRGDTGVEQVIEGSLEQYGKGQLSDAEITEGVPFESTSLVSEGEEESLDEEGNAMALVQTVYAQCLRQDREWVFVEDVDLAFERRSSVGLSQSERANLRERLTGEYLETRRRDGRMQVRVTQAGQAWLFNTGSAASGGGDEHRYVLREAFEAFTKLGFEVTLPTQDGEELPDGVASVPIDPMEAATPQEVDERMKQLEEEYPVCAALSDGKPVALEAETSTITRPMQTLTNLRKAMAVEQRCVFVCKDGTTEHGEFVYWAKRGEAILSGPPCVRSESGGERTFYGTSRVLEVSSGFAVRPSSASRSVWTETAQRFVNKDSDGDVHARVDDIGAVSVDEVKAYCSVDRTSGRYVVKCEEQTYRYDSVETFEEEWTRLYEPFVPEREFPREVQSEDYLFVVVPDSGSAYEEPQVVVEGECRSLSDYGSASTAGEESADESGDQTVMQMEAISESSNPDRGDDTIL